jgi:hypothetical protein
MVRAMTFTVLMFICAFAAFTAGSYVALLFS